MIAKEQHEILEKHGWNVDCESPFELSNKDGSFATGQAAEMVLFVVMGGQWYGNDDDVCAEDE